MKVLSINKGYQQPHFAAMKSTQFHGVDYICMRKLKAPIEKFNSIKDMHRWSTEELKKHLLQAFPARDSEVTLSRKDIISHWINGLFFHIKEFSMSFIFAMIKELTRELKPTNNDLPLTFNLKAFKKTFQEVQSRDPNSHFKLTDIYNKHLKETFPDIPTDGWVVIKSLTNDPMNYEDNISKLQMLSHRTWCTKTSYAKTHLMYGDFHVRLENGNPKTMIRFFDDEIDEIQSIGNKGVIKEDIPSLNEYISKNNFVINPKKIEYLNILSTQ